MTSTLGAQAESEAPAERAAAFRQLLDELGFEDRRLTGAELERAALVVASRPELWEDLVVDSREARWWIVLYRTPAYEVRLLSWEFDQSSGWHDHGGSCGGFVVTSGELEERYRGGDSVSVEEHLFVAGEHACFDASHIHDVSHVEGRPAVSIHAYSPPLTSLTMYEPTPYGFVVSEVVPDDRRQART